MIPSNKRKIKLLMNKSENMMKVQTKIDNGLPIDQLPITQLKSIGHHKKRKDVNCNRNTTIDNTILV